MLTCHCGGPIVDRVCLWCNWVDHSEETIVCPHCSVPSMLYAATDGPHTPLWRCAACDMPITHNEPLCECVASNPPLAAQNERNVEAYKQPSFSSIVIDPLELIPDKVEPLKSRPMSVCGFCFGSDTKYDSPTTVVCFDCQQPRRPLCIRFGPLNEEAARVTQEAAQQWLLRILAPQHKLRKSQWAELVKHESSSNVWKALLMRLPYHLLLRLKAEKFFEPSSLLSVVGNNGSGESVEKNKAPLNADVEHNCMLRQEWKMRRAYAQHESHEKCSLQQCDLTQPWLINCFNKKGIARKHLFTQRNLVGTEELHFVLRANHRPSNEPKTPKWLQPGECSIVDSLSHFQMSFNALTRNLFKGVDLTGVVIAGGAILASLLPFPDLLRLTIRSYELMKQILEKRLPKALGQYVEGFLSFNVSDYESQMRLHFEQKRYSYQQPQSFNSSDIDVFLVCGSAEEGKRRIEEIVNGILKNQSGITPTFVRSRSTLTLVLGSPYRHVQFILSLYRSVEELLCYFDLDCVCCAWDGKEVYVSPRALRALNTHHNFVDAKTLARVVEARRVQKYIARGFQCLLFENCIHEPRCDVVVGDAEFLLLDKLVKQSKGVDAAEVDEDEYNLATRNEEEESDATYPAQSLPSGSANIVARFVHSVNNSSEEQGRAPIYQLHTTLNACWEVPEMPGLRWKYVDFRLSRMGMMYLPRCYMCKTSRGVTSQAKCGMRPKNSVNVDENLRVSKPHNLLCEFCLALNKAKVAQWNANSLVHCVAVITGGRIKIGFETALLLLRAGCTVIITTRFPLVARQLYEAVADYNTFSSRLYVYGLDLRDLTRVYQFVQAVTCKFKRIHILINNAAQTIARPLAYYRELVECEQKQQESLGLNGEGLLCAGTITFQHKLKLSQAREAESVSGRKRAADGPPQFFRASKHVTLHAMPPSSSSSSSSSSITVQLKPFSSSSSPSSSTAPSVTSSFSSSSVITSSMTSSAASSPLATASSHTNTSNTTTTADILSLVPTRVSHLQPWSSSLLPPSVGLANCKEARNDHLFPPNKYDVHGTQLDMRSLTSWNSHIDEISPMEALEVHVVNSIAPFTLIQGFKPHMTPPDPFSSSAAWGDGEQEEAERDGVVDGDEHVIPDCSFIINVSSVEGQFNGMKSPVHPHTNMAKASMNMLTKTIGQEFAQQGIYVSSVDTGWITKMRPAALQSQTTAPLEPIDGAARICDPIFQGLSGHPQIGVFLQHFKVAPW